MSKEPILGRIIPTGASTGKILLPGGGKLAPMLEKDEFYDSPGRCIYCGRSDVPLTDEHIVPLGLNGYQVIRNASCAACQQTINTIESNYMQKQYGVLRDIVGRRSRKKSNYQGTVELVYPNGFRRDVKVDARHFPVQAVFAAYECGPGYLDGDDTPRTYTVVEAKVLGEFEFQKRLERIRALHGAHRVRIPYALDINIQSRLLCKIGHGLAVAHFGLDRFEPITTGYILGKEKHSPTYFVGGCGIPSSVRKGCTNVVGLTVFPHTGRDYIFAFIGIFAHLAFPVSTVVVGYLK